MKARVEPTVAQKQFTHRYCGLFHVSVQLLVRSG